MRVVRGRQETPYLRAEVEVLSDVVPTLPNPELEPLTESVRVLCAQIVVASPFLSDELVTNLQQAEAPAALTDLVVSILPSRDSAGRRGRDRVV